MNFGKWRDPVEVISCAKSGVDCLRGFLSTLVIVGLFRWKLVSRTQPLHCAVMGRATIRLGHFGFSCRLRVPVYFVVVTELSLLQSVLEKLNEAAEKRPSCSTFSPLSHLFYNSKVVHHNSCCWSMSIFFYVVCRMVKRARLEKRGQNRRWKGCKGRSLQYLASSRSPVIHFREFLITYVFESLRQHHSMVIDFFTGSLD